MGVFKERTISLLNLRTEQNEDVRMVLHFVNFDNLVEGMKTEFYFLGRRLQEVLHEDKEALLDSATDALFLKPMVVV